MTQQLLAKVTSITPVKGAALIASLGIIVFFSGLTNPFMGGGPKDNEQFLERALEKFPHDGRLWFSLSLLYYGQGNQARAKAAIAQATADGYSLPDFSSKITHGETISLPPHPELK